jgi:formiminoglutamate deiminase
VTSSSYLCEHAWLPDGRVGSEVLVDVADGRITRVAAGAEATPGAERLHGLVLPGAANGHSHAFHRALRGRTHGAGGTFWTWRDQMYELAARLDPERYHVLARATFAEMALAGFTAVGEFHYLHHGPDGVPYVDPNEMAHALVAAARDAGVRIALLDTCYLAGGVGRSLEGHQRRFGDGDAAAWAARVENLARSYPTATDVVVGAAAHSVRAVPAEQLPVVAAWARANDAPLHVHVSEQPAENEACLKAYGRTPTGVLADAGALGPRTTAVHATHLEAADIVLLGDHATHVCLCPTTERDLGDGIGPAHRLVDAGARMTLGTDSHAVIDAFEEARAVELDLRLATRHRGHLGVDTLLRSLTADGQASLGFGDAGRLEAGARADLVAVRLDSVRTAGADLATAAATVVYAATSDDVTDVVVDGRRVVRSGAHRLGDIGGMLGDAIENVWRDER